MKVTALIPAYNEEKTIAPIIKLLIQISRIEEIVVVDDGSKDNTYREAEQAGARVIKLSENQGKGGALQQGISEIDSDIILMLDGDLIGLREMHIDNLLIPILEDQADMTVGIFNEGRGLTDLAQFISPNLSGQRAVKRDIIKNMKGLKESGYGVEVAINSYVKKRGRVNYVELPELTHVMKEEKRGFARGVRDRSKMYWEIIRTLFKNRLKA